MKHWDSEFWSQHLQDLLFFAGWRIWNSWWGSWIGLGKGRLPCMMILPKSNFLFVTINPSFQLNKKIWKTFKMHQNPLIKMRYGASETVRFWVQQIFKSRKLAVASWNYFLLQQGVERTKCQTRDFSQYPSPPRGLKPRCVHPKTLLAEKGVNIET